MSAVFYFSPHPDDWQIFKGDGVFDDYQTGLKVVFLYITAGDDGKPDEHWRSREAGARSSLELLTGQTPVVSTRFIRGQEIPLLVTESTDSYFLRLPDGGASGAGTKQHNSESLHNLRTGQKPIHSVDGKLHFSTWDALIQTVRDIMSLHTGPEAGHWLHSPDYDTTANPDDHSDHLETGRIAEALGTGKYRLALWVGHDSEKREANVSEAAAAKRKELVVEYLTKSPAEAPWPGEGGIYENLTHRSYLRRMGEK